MSVPIINVTEHSKHTRSFLGLLPGSGTLNTCRQIDRLSRFLSLLKCTVHDVNPVHSPRDEKKTKRKQNRTYEEPSST